MSKKNKSSKVPIADLYRGDAATSVSVPTPGADDNVVRHILWLGGAGQETPYTSTTHSHATAQYFARAGRIWTTTRPLAILHGAALIEQSELLQNLKGKGKGRRFQSAPRHVARARVLAERHQEHLLDWTGTKPSEIAGRIAATFS